MSMQLEDQVEYGEQSSWDNQKTGCHWGISDLAVGCVVWFKHPHLGLSPSGYLAGLAPVVADGVTHVDITLPPSLYAAVLGIK